MIASWSKQCKLRPTYQMIRKGCEPHLLTVHNTCFLWPFWPKQHHLSNHLLVFCSIDQRTCTSPDITGCHHLSASLFTRHHHQPYYYRLRASPPTGYSLGSTPCESFLAEFFFTLPHATPLPFPTRPRPDANGCGWPWTAVTVRTESANVQFLLILSPFMCSTFCSVWPTGTP